MDLIFGNLFFLSTLVFTYSNATILTILNTRDLYSRSAAYTQLNWWWRDFAQIKLSKENHKQGLTNNYGRLIGFEPNFKTVLFQLVWFSWLFDASFVSRFVFDVATLGVR